ncbi:hypothetical protein V502_05237 [Pseudogymnoascus sp. VKM F-4520 (FW-2644)]|nr:hypothetical protein V502_05237 [Pseudogymnoascus sp. VKM F-4520 (FW-2644)]
MDRFFGKLKKKAGGGRSKAGTDKAHRPLEASRPPSLSLSSEPKAEVPAEPSFWNPNEDWPREAFETTLRPPVAPSGDRHSNYRPYRRAPETPPAVTSHFPPGFSSHPYENSKKSYPPPRTSKTTTQRFPIKITRKELPKKELPKDDKLPNNEKIHQVPEVPKVTVHAVPQVDKEPEPEPEPESDPSTRSASPEIEGSIHSVEIPSLGSKTSIISPTKAERTAQLLAKKYARLVNQQEELHAKKYMRIIHHREELETRGILWPTSPSTHEFLDDEKDPQVYEFPQFVPKPLILRNQREPQSEGLRSNQRQISNGVVHDYEAAKLESWRQFYGKGEMMQTLQNEIDEYLGSLMFKRLLKETNAAANGQSAGYRTEVTVRKYWDGVRGFLALDFKNEDAMR